MIWRARRVAMRQGMREAPEVDITAFMSLMVILIPFLLITAVFSRIAIIELDVASQQSAHTSDVDPLALEVRVRAGSIEVSYRASKGALRAERTETRSDLAWLTEQVAGLKGKFPSSTQATILFEPDVRYETVIGMMDAVRWRGSGAGEDSEPTELFGDIVLGPLAAGTSPSGDNP